MWNTLHLLRQKRIWNNLKTFHLNLNCAWYFLLYANCRLLRKMQLKSFQLERIQGDLDIAK